MTKTHLYNTTLTWDGADGGTTINYKFYSRNHAVEIEGKASFVMSADPAFLGDASKLNPEDCLLVALSSCHMLSYLAIAAMKGVEVTAYVDRASGTMIQEGHGGRFTEVILKPVVTISAHSDEALARELHHTASESCFIGSSVNFPVKHMPTIVVQDRMKR